MRLRNRLEKFEQGPWNGSGFSGALSAQHDWTLDEQGNWNKHSDQDSTPGVDWTPPVDSVNAYTSWPTRVDYNRNGTIESDEKEKSLSLSYDAARAFLYEREESQGQYLLYRHDALGRLSTISRRLNGIETELVRYGYTAAQVHACEADCRAACCTRSLPSCVSWRDQQCESPRMLRTSMDAIGCPSDVGRVACVTPGTVKLLPAA